MLIYILLLHHQTTTVRKRCGVQKLFGLSSLLSWQKHPDYGIIKRMNYDNNDGSIPFRGANNLKK